MFVLLFLVLIGGEEWETGPVLRPAQQSTLCVFVSGLPDCPLDGAPAHEPRPNLTREKFKHVLSDV